MRANIGAMCENDGCEAPTTPLRAGARYCSRSCQLAAYNARRRAGETAPRRPPSDGASAIGVRLPSSTRERLDALAEARGIRRGALLRQAVEAFLAELDDAQEHSAA